MVNKLLLLLSVIILYTTEGYCQQKTLNEKRSLTDSTGKVLHEKRAHLYTFPHLNSLPFYYNKQQLKRIQKLQEEKQHDALYPLLSDYIRNFGVENFFRDNAMLWQLARLEEAKGDTLSAIALYKLLLKHYHPDMKLSLPRQRLDSLGNEKKEDYVPLQYYYQLVEYRKEIDTLQPPHGIYLNMGDDINSADGDYGPALNASGDMLVFTSKRNKIELGLNTKDNEDLMVSRKVGDLWTAAASMKEINTPYNEGSACISNDGKSLFFSRCNSPDGKGSCDLYVSYRQEDGSWGKAMNLGAHINSISWDSHPSLSHSGDTLYFASDRLGGFGLSDIYFTIRNQQGQWSAAFNLGPVINTKGNEVSPFYHPQHRVLYFSSDGHLLNFGEFDIYKAYPLGPTWDEPKNIGPLVNGTGSEFYFTIDREAKNLYYARSEQESMGNLDLYSFPLPMEAQPLATTRLEGSIRDEQTGKPFANGIVSIIDLDNGIEVAPRFLRPDGSFAFSLINNNNYLIIIQGESFFRLEEIFFLDGDTEMHRKAEAVSSRLKFDNMKFDNGKADLQPDMYGDLDKIADFLLDNPDFSLRIEGHTDTDGKAELNLKLSQQRADAIKEYLTSFGGIQTERIEAIGYGSSRPIIAEESSEEDKKMNRRVEFNIYREESK